MFSDIKAIDISNIDIISNSVSWKLYKVSLVFAWDAHYSKTKLAALQYQKYTVEPR